MAAHVNDPSILLDLLGYSLNPVLVFCDSHRFEFKRRDGLRIVNQRTLTMSYEG